jgi:hypothetical protein
MMTAERRAAAASSGRIDRVLHQYEVAPERLAGDHGREHVSMLDPGRRDRPDDRRPLGIQGAKRLSHLGQVAAGWLEHPRGRSILVRRTDREPGELDVVDRARLVGQLRNRGRDVAQARGLEDQRREPFIDRGAAPEQPVLTRHGGEVGAQLG